MKAQARVAGFLYLVVIVTALYAEAIVRGNLIVPGDPAGTARAILAAETVYRLGFVADLLNFASYIGVVLIFQRLFAPAGRTLSLVAAGFGMTGIVTGAANMLNQYAPLFLLKGAPYLAVFTAAQLQSWAYIFVRLHSFGYLISMVFFGAYCVLLGSLILRANFVPRVLGVLLAVAGTGYLVNSFGIFLNVDAVIAYNIFLLLPGFVAELSLTLWLIVMGVDEDKWRAQAAAQ